MKKIFAAILTVFILTSNISVCVSANESSKLSVIMAINDNRIIVNGELKEITPPISVFGKTYVDLYSVAPFFNLEVLWIEDYIGYFKVSGKGNAADFTLILNWDDLINKKHKFFVKDSKIFVSIRELAELVECDISYYAGKVTVGDVYGINNEIYNNIDEYNFDDYVYKTYPKTAYYVVNPYGKYSYENMLNDANRLKDMYPDLIKTYSIGKSVEGRDLLLIELGRGEKKVFVCGTHHAREYIATIYLMYAIDRYAYDYRTNSNWWQYNPKDILDKVTFCIVPMVNPDGVNLVQNGIYATEHADELSGMKIFEGARYGYSAWKANVNGVDVNWNYDKDWTIERNKNERGSTGFNGLYPESEPETVAVSRYVDNNSFSAYLSFHTQGQIFYWAENPDNPTYIHQAIAKDTGFTPYYDDGTGIGGSFFDYVYRKFKKPTITVELCPYVGNYPYPESDFDTVWKPAKNILLIVGNYI